MQSRTIAVFAPVALALVAGAAFRTAMDDSRFKWKVHDMDRPQPKKVDASGHGAPSDAVVLFGGGDLSAWRNGNGSAAEWVVKDGVIEINPGSGDIHTAQEFGDCQLHIEWSIPPERNCESQHGCNSGVFLLDRYEIQVLESRENVTYADGMAGSLYGQYPPLVNPARAKGEWNVYDIVFRGPRFDDKGAVTRPAYVTVLLNGVLVQDHSELLGITVHARRAEYQAHAAKGPIRLQDHGDMIRFRNIWVRELGEPAVAE